MIEVTGTYERLSFRPDGDAEITFRIPAKLRGSLMAGIDKILETGVKDLCIKVGRKRKQRSLDANAYCFVLIDKLAAKLGTTKEEVYKQAIREIGGVSEVVCVQNIALETFCRMWSCNGLGWQTETFESKIEGCTNVILYYGSSTFSTAQMSALLDLIIQDCHEQGIVTETPNQIAEMMSRWGNQ
jgi:hypothetical protein